MIIGIKCKAKTEEKDAEEEKKSLISSFFKSVINFLSSQCTGEYFRVHVLSPIMCLQLEISFQ